MALYVRHSATITFTQSREITQYLLRNTPIHRVILTCIKYAFFGMDKGGTLNNSSAWNQQQSPDLAVCYWNSGRIKGRAKERGQHEMKLQVKPPGKAAEWRSQSQIPSIAFSGWYPKMDVNLTWLWCSPKTESKNKPSEGRRTTSKMKIGGKLPHNDAEFRI